MTAKEAIKLIQNEILCVKTADTCDRDCGKCQLVKPTGDILEAYDMAISALEAQDVPDTNVGSKDDCVSRQAAIDSIRECAEAAHSNHEWDMEQGYLNAIECLEEEPSAQPALIYCQDCKHCVKEDVDVLTTY